MKIVINALSARIGGGQTYLNQLLRRLPDADDLQIFIYAADSLDIPDHPRITRLQSGLRSENPVLRTLWEKYVLPRKLRQLNPDIFFCPGGVLATQVPERCRTVTMFRNMVPFDDMVKKQMPYGLQRIRVWLLEKVMLKSMARADLVIFISEYARSVIEARIRVKKAITIPHGIASHFRTQDPHKSVSDILPGKPYVLYVSRFESYKHHYEVVSAYMALPSVLQEKYDLVLVGENDNPFGERVRDLIGSRGFTGKIHMLGGVKYATLPNVYHQAELIVFASSCENCPNILLEALSAGRPIICSSVMPMPEFGGDAVAYFDPADVNSIRDQMSSLLSAPALSAEYAERAVRQGAKYDWDVTAQQTWSNILAL